MFLFFFIFFPFINSKYKEIELKLSKDEIDSDLPLYIETIDSCSKWIPSLFSSLLIFNYEIDTIDTILTPLDIKIQNFYSIKEYKIPLNAHVWITNISIFMNIYVAQSRVLWPKYCLFGLDYSEVLVLYGKQKLNSIKNLIPQQIDKFIFSFGKWDLSKKDYIYSKLYIGDSHEIFF